MRHAADYGLVGPFVTYRGMLVLNNEMGKLQAELKEKFPNKELRIIHSELPRAKHTALLIREMIGGNIGIYLEGDPRLNSDKLLINEEYVSQIVISCEDSNKVCLILSHQPDIKSFCKNEFENSEFKCMTIEIEEKPKAEKGTPDDLPF